MSFEPNISLHLSLPAFTAVSDQDRSHILDTGATIHCTPYLDLLFNVHTILKLTLTVANSEQLELRLAGDMRVDVPKTESEYSTIILKNVYYNSKLPFTLMSICQLPNFTFLFSKHRCTISNEYGHVLGTVSKSSRFCERKLI